MHTYAQNMYSQVIISNKYNQLGADFSDKSELNKET